MRKERRGKGGLHK